MTYLHCKNEPKDKKLLNWALQLSEYDYEIVHTPSTLNGVSYCFSRIKIICLISNIPSLLNDYEVISEQSKDKVVSNG